MTGQWQLWESPAGRIARATPSTRLRGARDWVPPQPNGWWPRVSPTGDYVAYGNVDLFVVDLRDLVERPLDTFGLRANFCGWLDAETLLWVANGTEQHRLYTVRVGEWVSRPYDAPPEVVSGNWFDADAGHWASSLARPARLTYDGRVMGSGYGCAVAGEWLVASLELRPDQWILRAYRGGVRQRDIEPLGAANSFDISSEGVVSYGYWGPARLNYPDGRDVDCTVTPWRAESVPAMYHRADGELWIATGALLDNQQPVVFVRRADGPDNQAVLVPGEAVAITLAEKDGELVVAMCGDSGECRVAWVPFDAPLSNLAPAEEPVTVPPVGRALYMGAFEFGSTSTVPRNVRLRIREDDGALVWPGVPVVEGPDGQPLYSYASGNPDGDPDAIERAVDAAKREWPALPCVAYVPFSASTRAYARWPRNADVMGVEGYRKVNESMAACEARLRAACGQHPRVLLIGQGYTSNANNATDLAALVPLYARVLRDQPNIEAFLLFSGGLGRNTGYESHPELWPLYRTLRTSIMTPASTPTPDPTPAPGHNPPDGLPRPRITISAPSFPVRGEAPLRVGPCVWQAEGGSGPVETVEWQERPAGGPWRRSATNAGSDPDHTYLFPKPGGYEIRAVARNSAGEHATGRLRAVEVRAPEARPAPPEPVPGPEPGPAPSPTSPWEAMVRETIRAVYEQDQRARPTREDEDAILARCFAPPQGDGWIAGDIEAHVRALPRPEPVRVALAGRIRRDGRFFVNDLGTFRPVFCSALSLLRPQRGDSDVRAFLEWAVATGLSGVRVFAGSLTWAGQTAEGARDRLSWFLDEARQRGLYVLVSAITDSKDGGYDPESHLRDVARLCAVAENTLLEGANEPYHPTQREDVRSANTLDAWGARYVAESVCFALGAADDDESTAFAGQGAFVVAHLDRGRDKWNQVRRVRELEVLSSATGRPVINQEPIGADEAPRAGRRESDPDFFFCMGVLNRTFEVGGVFHFEAGLQGVLPGPVQQQCAEAFVAGSRLVPTEDRLTFKNARWADSPVANAAFGDESGAGGRLVRAYTGVAGNRAWTVIVGKSGDPGLELRGGWRVAGSVVERGAVEVLALER